ncbi:MAG: pantoate--beta-alanine ligase [Gemmatimonadota bacterium]|nr:pantoate--beta-alanine ligase [Gemmatimonadota bacterium]
MDLVVTRDAVRTAVARAHRAGERIALVPTMGSLHEGHLSLIDRARERADRVAISIFVNPLQFGAGEDLDRYPRDLERDLALAEERGADLAFAPDEGEMYPSGPPLITVVPAPEMEGALCGATRPGHFRGVLTVVAKLFCLLSPAVAVFGQKDYQQSVLIRRMVDDLGFGVEIDVAPIVREADGLALSSRNVYLSPDEREKALSLARALSAAGALYASGERSGEVLRSALGSHLDASGVSIEYAEIVDPTTLTPVACVREGSVCAVAVRVGKTRLIDNIILHL